jgi:hypothetical protein
MAWSFLNHLLGLRDLGFEPVFMEAPIEPNSCYDVAAADLTDDPTYGLAFLKASLASVGLDGMRWCYLDGDRYWGMSRDEAVDVLERSSVLLNVTASSWTDDFARASRRILIDCDAPLTQIQLANGRQPLSGIASMHDTFFTYGVNLAEGRALGPTAGLRWQPTRPPVHLPSFEVTAPPNGGAWTSVTSWSSTATFEWRGDAFGDKARSYRELMDLPARVPVSLELAAAGDAPADDLCARGWKVIDPVPVTRTVDTFRHYVTRSRAEFGVAKHAFVHSQNGAFNDRALAYLASGRPVVCSDTGLGWLPPSDGVVPFTDLDAAAAGIRRVEADIEHHGRAARRFVETHFSAGDVIADLLREADVPLPVSNTAVAR